MDRLILVKYGEIILKGLNRKIFEDVLLKNIRRTLKSVGEFKLIKSQGAIYVRPSGEGDFDEAVNRIRKVFGIAVVSPAYNTQKNMQDIMECIALNLAPVLSNAKTFKVEAKRADKAFPLKSPQICMEVGGYVLDKFPNISVDVHNPEILVNVDIREQEAYIYCERFLGAGGLPTGTGGKAALLLSGGIDSPVAGYLIAKRGVEIDAINFFSYPYTSERAKEKVIELARILSTYTSKVRLHIVPFTEIQLAIRDKCPEEQLTIIMRRMMTRIAEKIAEKNGAKALITGESLGQVASQTMEAIAVTNAVAKMPVFRPLIGLDKEEIVTYARKIGTFETSILPYEDCCTIFVPKHPNTKPQLEKIEQSEQFLEMDRLIEEAVAGVEVIEVS